MGCCGSSSTGSSSGQNDSAKKDSSCCATGEEVKPLEAKPFMATDENPIILTPSAIDAVRHALSEEGEPGDGLRVSVVGGGCSGYQYNLDFEKEPRIGDLSLDFGGVKIFVDPISAGYLKGTTIDYVSGLHGTGFKFENPNAKRTCGCGSSFS